MPLIPFLLPPLCGALQDPGRPLSKFCFRAASPELVAEAMAEARLDPIPAFPRRRSNGVVRDRELSANGVPIGNSSVHTREKCVNAASEAGEPHGNVAWSFPRGLACNLGIAFRSEWISPQSLWGSRSDPICTRDMNISGVNVGDR